MYSNERRGKPKGTSDLNARYISFAERLADIVLPYRTTNITDTDIKKWATEIRLLRTQNNIDIPAINAVLNWYSEYIGGEFIPEAYSGSSFRKKFPNLQAAMKRSETRNNRRGPLPSTNETYDDIPVHRINNQRS
jgi:hypothetical protein